ncbi:MAG TPA: hypothetical protein VK024_09280 [Actinomycetaceae bacterium]|nr:hypothetical protein [Actinomycetaceae bacterium]
MDVQGETRYDRRQRLQARNDRNALITGLFGVALFVLGIFIGAASGDAGFGGIFMVLGLVAFVAGLIFRGRPVR